MRVYCENCDKPLPLQVVRAAERDGFTVISGLCEECSPIGQVSLDLDLASKPLLLAL